MHGEESEDCHFSGSCSSPLTCSVVDCGNSPLLQESSEDFHIRFENFTRKKFSSFADGDGAISSPIEDVSPIAPLNFPHNRSFDEETLYFADAEDQPKSISSPSSSYSLDISRIDSLNNLSFQSCASSPFNSPLSHTPERFDSPIPGYDYGQERPISPTSANVDDGSSVYSEPTINDVKISDHVDESLTIHSTREKSGNVWSNEHGDDFWDPPPPEDEEADIERSTLDSDEDDDQSVLPTASSFSNDTLPTELNLHDAHKSQLQSVVHNYFKALVSQLLQELEVFSNNESTKDSWLDTVMKLALEAAAYVKPDTSHGGSMDPGSYVKVKCLASGKPYESSMIKGVVCTKNVKHKRMTSKYRNARLLLLGGALEYQKLPDQLESINTLIKEEVEYTNRTISNISMHHPHVLVVEKSVSPLAQKILLENEISLVLNVKTELLKRIARCSGAYIVNSVDELPAARLGWCESFHVERIVEDHESSGTLNKKPMKTLMFFEGCPRRLGCTILLKGASRGELKKVKHALHLAIFAAYHLLLETSFLIDERAQLPQNPVESPSAASSKPVSPLTVIAYNDSDSSETETSSEQSKQHITVAKLAILEKENWNLDSYPEHRDRFLLTEHPESPAPSETRATSPASWVTSPKALRPSTSASGAQISNFEEGGIDGFYDNSNQQIENSRSLEERNYSKEGLSISEARQSILVSLSSRSLTKGTICERPQLLRIRFYGSFDKPLGLFLQDDLFHPAAKCSSCNGRTESHVRCYVHEQGTLTIFVRNRPERKLSGEREGKIWMWHHCLRCGPKHTSSNQSKRVVMSNSAWGLSFGKFLELSFSNNATANRQANCGHSLQKDCHKFYGCGSMFASFRYDPVDILNVSLPPSLLDYKSQIQFCWFRKEAADVHGKMESLYGEVSAALQKMEQDVTASAAGDPNQAKDLQAYIGSLKGLLNNDIGEHKVLLQDAVVDNCKQTMLGLDILKLNKLKHCILVDSREWDHRLCQLNGFLKVNNATKSGPDKLSTNSAAHLRSSDEKTCVPNLSNLELPLEKARGNSDDLLKDAFMGTLPEYVSFESLQEEGLSSGDTFECFSFQSTTSFSSTSLVSPLSERNDIPWAGNVEVASTSSLWSSSFHHQVSNALMTNQQLHSGQKKARAPVRGYSFDSGFTSLERSRRRLFLEGQHASSGQSLYAQRDSGSFEANLLPNMLRTFSHGSPRIAQRSLSGYTASFISPFFMDRDGPLILPATGHSNIMIAIYEHEPSSVIAYALSSKEYAAFLLETAFTSEASRDNEKYPIDQHGSPKVWPDDSTVDNGDFQIRHSESGATSTSHAKLASSSTKSPHFRLLYDNDTTSLSQRLKFSVTSYFAKQFHSLRQMCCPSEIDYIGSLSRCHRWKAQGGKSHAYFAKSLDDRFVIKQLSKTEFESFQEFAPEYFNYLSDSLSSRSPTCLAKVFGVYQVIIKNLNGGKEFKMDLMVMENVFFGREISRVYDLKGSLRSRYNPITSGINSVLLDQNLLENLQTKPIFLGSKPKRNLERAVWNDTSFLASIDVMDYSLLVGVDEKRKELVVGIIDFMRQYTWDKQLETWVKASGILGGSKKVSPTVISPKQYKRRFRKAISSYFLMVPD